MSAPCTTPDCEYPAFRRGLCNRHHKRARKDGTLPPLPTLEERFWAKVNKTAVCWLWTGAIDAHGYGRVKFRDKVTGAHRASYELVVGPIPEGLQIDHLCRVTNCVNPFHLEAVTGAVNIHRSNGRAAVNRRATHCPQGHPYDEKNTYHRPTGGRSCRTCFTERDRRRRAAS